MMAFAGFGGGGGGSPGKGTKGKIKGKKKKAKKTSSASGGTGRVVPVPCPNLLTPEGRMEHMRARIASADVSPIAKLSLSANKSSGGQLVLDVDPNAIAVVDNFLGPELVAAMRSEAESLLPDMVPSQSTRWDEATQSVVPYSKRGVLSTQIEGGSSSGSGSGSGGYEKSPRLVEYIVTLTSHLSDRLNRILPDAYHLARDEQTNKLAVCLGDGSYYDKHIDNLGGGGEGGGDGDGDGGGTTTSNSNVIGDRRKLTALLYLQPSGSHDGQPPYPNESVDDDPRGGYFRAYDVPDEADVTCIAPRGDRLMLFWSDSLVHDVSESHAPNGDADRRWALTVWFIADRKGGVIRATDAAIEARHFESSGGGIGKG